MAKWHPDWQAYSPLPSPPLLLHKFSSHLLCADPDTWQIHLVELNYQKIISFLAGLDFLPLCLHELFHCVVTQVVLVQRQQEFMNEESEEGNAEEFCHFQWQLALGSAQMYLQAIHFSSNLRYKSFPWGKTEKYMQQRNV